MGSNSKFKISILYSKYLKKKACMQFISIEIFGFRLLQNKL